MLYHSQIGDLALIGPRIEPSADFNWRRLNLRMLDLRMMYLCE